EAAQVSSLTRAAAGLDPVLRTNMGADSQLNLVGILRGDVNGSWTGSAGSIDLDVQDPTYFQRLSVALATPLDVWGF
ncbi:MAG TPA: hypothetical protein VEA40_27335, partial [Ramlibacter sp.]|nr:hypothetical protein [Ramlibacter sp.]